MTDAPKEKTGEPHPPPPKPSPAERLSYWRDGLGLFLFWLAADQLTKLWAIRVLRPDWWGSRFVTPEEFAQTPIITIIPGFLQFRYAENTGAAFSIMEGQTLLLVMISLLASAGLAAYWYFLPPAERWGRAAVALIASGAVGNLIDRAGRGAVVDFVDAYVGQYHWPTFNVADSCMCVGAAILVIRFMRGKI